MFTNPFPAGEPAQDGMTREELVRALRLDLAAEQDAIALYTVHAERSGNPDIAKAILAIADEERVHAGEFMTMIAMLDPREATLFGRGAREVTDDEVLSEIVRKMFEK